MPFLVYSSRQQQPEWTAASDREVMAAVQNGDEQAFDELIRRKTAPLLQVVNRITRDREEARDIVQVVFLRVWEKRRQFDPRWSPNTWVYRIGVNLAIDLVRSRRHRDQALGPLGAHLRAVKTGDSGTLADLEHRQVAAILDRLSESLPEKQRLVFLLVGVEGMPADEVGEIIGCRPSTVRNHLFAARKRLRQELSRLYPEYVPGRPESGPPEGALA
jgi:RNA polymerase sigma-70 factor (ECF subfamily)